MTVLVALSALAGWYLGAGLYRAAARAYRRRRRVFHVEHPPEVLDRIWRPGD